MSDREHEIEKKALIIAFIINTSFIFVELVAAWYSGSLTLLSDAIHMITDSSSILLAIVASYIATRGADKVRTFGYQRVEVLSGLINGISLIFIVLYIVYDAYQRFQSPQMVKGEIVLIIGILGLFVNLSAAYFLHGKDSVNAKGAYLHLLSDALGSIAAIASGVIIIMTKIYLVDILTAIIVSILILYSIKDMIIKSLNILLEGVPEDKEIGSIQYSLEEIDGVVDVHHVHIWSIDSRKDALTAHIVVGDNYSHAEVLEESLSKMKQKGIEHPTIQIETQDFNKKKHNCYKNSDSSKKET